MLYNMGEVCYNQIGTYGFEAKREKERFTVVCILFCRSRSRSLFFRFCSSVIGRPGIMRDLIIIKNLLKICQKAALNKLEIDTA